MMLTNEDKRRVLEKLCRISACTRCPINTHVGSLYELSHGEVERYFDTVMRFLFGKNPFTENVPPEEVTNLIEKRFLEVN